MQIKFQNKVAVSTATLEVSLVLYLFSNIIPVAQTVILTSVFLLHDVFTLTSKSNFLAYVTDHMLTNLKFHKIKIYDSYTVILYMSDMEGWT